MSESPASPPESAVATERTNEVERLRQAIALIQDNAARLGADVTELAMAPLRDRLAALDAQDGPSGCVPRLRQVSVLFIDVVDSTRLLRGLDAEDGHHVLDGALRRFGAIVHAHGGRVLRYTGDGLKAVFGMPEPAEDDPARAVFAGLEILQQARSHAAEVQRRFGLEGFALRAGIHTGPVAMGAGAEDAHTLVGATVHLAARMEQSAPAGALRISHDTHAHVRGLFELEAQEPLTFKGVDAPVHSYLVQRAKPREFRTVTRGIEGVATRMVGRDAELGVLQDAFRRVVEPVAGLECVAVVADAGVGKSRLLHEFRNWADARGERHLVFQARATPQTRGQGYGLLRDLLAWRLEISDSDSMDVAKAKLEAGIKPLFLADEGEAEAQAHAHLLGQLIGLDYSESIHIRGIREDGQQIRNRGFNAAAQALRRIAAQDGAPLVVYLDDLHWADDPSLDFIDYLAQVNRDVPMLLVALTRPTLFERRPDKQTMTRVSLNPLDTESSRDLADELLKNFIEIPDSLRELLTARAEGNPFYMEELVKMLIDQKTIDTSGARWSVNTRQLASLNVPQTLTGVIQARLDGLPSAERNALQLASVIGQHFWDAALEHLEAGAAPLLRALSQRGLVSLKDAIDRSDDIREYAFHHQILHQVTYDTVLKRIKSAAHARTAEWLMAHSGTRAKALLGTAAEHYERAGDAAHAAEAYAQAAEYAAGTFANESVLDYVGRSLELAAPDDYRLRHRLYEAREATLELLGRSEPQRKDIDALKHLADQLGDASLRAAAALRLAIFAIRTGDYDTADREAQRATALATDAGNEELALLAAYPLAVAKGYRGNPGSGRAIAAAALARAQALGLQRATGKLANAASTCAASQRDWFAGLHYLQLNLSSNRIRGDRRGEAISLGNMGVQAVCLGDFASARRHLTAALRLNQSQGGRTSEAINMTYLSEIAWRSGDGAQALELAEGAVRILTEVRAPLYLSEALRALGNAELDLGRHADSAVAFERAEAEVRKTGNLSRTLEALEAQARLALARGDGSRATATMARLLVEAGGEAPAYLDSTTARQSALLVSARQPLIQLTMHRVWSHIGDPRAKAALAEAHRCLHATADIITDAFLRNCYLDDIAEHREIESLFALIREAEV